jgi:hypothetical protein
MTDDTHWLMKESRRQNVSDAESRLVHDRWERAFLAGFAAGVAQERERCAGIAENHPNDPAAEPYGFCNVCGGGPEIARTIRSQPSGISG